MRRGRPAGSPVRQNVTELLSQFGELHGYDVYKHYVKLFPKVTMRAVYYSLRNGVKKGHFRIARVEKKTGNYSWGPEAQRVYYALGEAAKPVGDAKVKKYFEGLTESKNPKRSLLSLKPQDWGKGTERLSEKIDDTLY
ncbi:hypothetical protein HYV85_02455 [Candidatus Woesearchaeota archaeon]|nr:hypothetical protein [Candidatus Woesearchaeota archaeon]